MNKIKTFPFVLINIGLLILLNNIIQNNIWSTYWPTIFLTIGTIVIINSINEK